MHLPCVEMFLLLFVLKGNWTPDQNLACFVLCLKIINTFFEKITYASYIKLSKELKNSTEIYAGLVVLELLIKTIFWLFWSIT